MCPRAFKNRPIWSHWLRLQRRWWRGVKLWVKDVSLSLSLSVEVSVHLARKNLSLEMPKRKFVSMFVGDVTFIRVEDWPSNLDKKAGPTRSIWWEIIWKDKLRELFSCKILYFTLSSEYRLNKFTWFTNWFSFHRLCRLRKLVRYTTTYLQKWPWDQKDLGPIL